MKSVLKKNKRAFSVALFFILSTGCVTKIKTTDLANLAQVNSHATGFLFTYKFQVEDQVVGQDGCTVIFKNVNDGAKIELNVKYGKEFLLAETRPGIYYLHDFSCGRYQWDLAETPWAQFHVEKDKVSLIAPIRFKITDTKRISARKTDRKDTYQQVTTIWGLLNDETKKSLISGYTLKPITEDLINNNDSWGVRKISFNGKTFDEIKKKKFANFKSCYSGEEQTNGLWLGQVKVDVEYKSDQVPEVKIEDENHTFSNHFIDCVKSEISGFKKIDVHVKKAKIVL